MEREGVRVCPPQTGREHGKMALEVIVGFLSIGQSH